MCVAVSAIAPPRQRSLIRSASSTGVAVFSEVVAQSLAHIWIEVDNTNTTSSELDCVPCTLPLPANVGTVVVRFGDKIATISGVSLGPISRVRYEGSPSIVEIRGTAEWKTKAAIQKILSGKIEIN